MNYGLLTDRRGCPVAVSVYDGNTSDPKTLMPQVHKLKKDFGIQTLVLVGDRGMISQKAIDELRGAGPSRLDHGAQDRADLERLVEGGQLQAGAASTRSICSSSPRTPTLPLGAPDRLPTSGS